MNKVLLLFLFAATHAASCVAQSQSEFEFDVATLVSAIQPVPAQMLLENVKHTSEELSLNKQVLYKNMTAKNLAQRLANLHFLEKDAIQFKAEVSYLFADIKYDGENLAILELGEGKNGGYRSFDAIFEQGRIWKGFWKYANSLGLPIYYVGPAPSFDPINKIGISLNDKISWSDFSKVSGRWTQSLEQLIKRPDFKVLVSTKGKSDSSRIKDYKAIVVYKYRDDREPHCLLALEKFKSKYPDILVLDSASRPFAVSKKLNDVLFRSSAETALFRPMCKLYPKKYDTQLAKRIINDIGTDFFIIKPVDSGMSNGIIMTSREQLDSDLRRIFARPVLAKGNAHPGTFNYRPTETQSYSYWPYDTNKEFMIEAYVPSRTITVLGKKYDPTARVVFALVHDDGKVKIKFLEHWWKIAPKALNEDASLTLKHVSQYRPDLKELPAAQLTLSQADEEGMRKLFAQAMAGAYIKMLLLENDDV